jgi:hypothetical protein
MLAETLTTSDRHSNTACADDYDYFLLHLRFSSK